MKAFFEDNNVTKTISKIQEPVASKKMIHEGQGRNFNVRLV